MLIYTIKCTTGRAAGVPIAQMGTVYQAMSFSDRARLASVAPFVIGDAMSTNDAEIANFTESAMFDRTFDEGMALVEETARYLDGKGREEARGLPRRVAMLYAGESMRVTTRLMQAASWLLVQRAVRDGDMRAEDAARDRNRLGSKEICRGGR